MCGIAGLYAYLDVAPPVDRAELSRMNARMAPRGPDGSGDWFSADGRVGFTHRRLAIIDLSERGAQPMHSADGTLTITFNGEIYNYLELRSELMGRFGARFNTDGDTEVIVAAYHYLGTSVVSRLRGMFAFLIWDSERRVVFGARDPFGIKPLFYATGPGGSAFASEKKSLLHLVNTLGITEEVGHKAFQHYLVLQYVPEPDTVVIALSKDAGALVRV